MGSKQSSFESGSRFIRPLDPPGKKDGDILYPLFPAHESRAYRFRPVLICSASSLISTKSFFIFA